MYWQLFHWTSRHQNPVVVMRLKLKEAFENHSQIVLYIIANCNKLKRLFTVILSPRILRWSGFVPHSRSMRHIAVAGRGRRIYLPKMCTTQHDFTTTNGTQHSTTFDSIRPQHRAIAQQSQPSPKLLFAMCDWYSFCFTNISCCLCLWVLL